MAHVKNHDYHILNPSLWPLAGAVFGFIMLFGGVLCCCVLYSRVSAHALVVSAGASLLFA